MSLWDAGVDLGATLVKAVAVPADRPLEAFETFVAPAGDERLLADGDPRHQPKPPTRTDWARVTPARRHRGHVSW